MTRTFGSTSEIISSNPIKNFKELSKSIGKSTLSVTHLDLQDKKEL